MFLPWLWGQVVWFEMLFVDDNKQTCIPFQSEQLAHCQIYFYQISLLKSIEFIHANLLSYQRMLLQLA